jgi:hypothetical protein
MDTGSATGRARFGLKGCLGFGVFGLVLCISFLLTMCVSKVEVMQAKSPDGTFIASVFEINGGATTDFAYEVNVSRNWPTRWDHAVAGFYGAGRSDCAYGVNLRWLSNDTLLIAYKDAKSTDVDQAVQLSGRTVRIVTKSGVNDPIAPCGGMEEGLHD